MRRDSTIAILLVLGAVLFAWALHGYLIDSSRGAVRTWVVAIEGMVTAGAVLAVWRFARTRRTAALATGVAALVVLAGEMGVVDLAGWLVASSLGWAVLLTLVVRLMRPEPAGVGNREDVRTHAT